MFFINLTCKCYVTWTIVILFVVVFSPRMEAPYFIFKGISVGVNKVLLLLLQYGCPVVAILDLAEAFISQSASIDFIK